MANQVLAGTVMRIIRDPWISKVRFTLGEFSIFDWQYERVAMAIARGKITCEVGVKPNRELRSGLATECRYDPETRQLQFPDEQYGSSSGRQRFSIVHEATHASFDIQYGNGEGKEFLAIDDEAAAWLAQSVYMRSSPYFWDGPIVPGDPIELALMLADKIMAVPNYRDQGSPPYSVPPADTIALKQSVAKIYSFEGGAAGIKHVYHGLRP